MTEKTDSDFIYQYPALRSGTLVKRYKRFLADIRLETGEVITAHCPNTGPMTGICKIGNPVIVSRSNNPKRKLPYTWEAIQIQNTWVGVNTALPNRVVKLGLERGIFPELANYPKIRSEVRYGKENKSRIDFLLTSEDDRTNVYVEVKNTTWTDGKIALFPDTVTTRGQKHLQELIAVLPNSKAVMLYFINRGDCNSFAPGDSADPEYGKLFREAMAAGVKILPYRFEVTPQGIRYLGLANLSIS